MIFQVDFQAGKPVYLQLADQIRYAAASGRLRPGEPLPSLRPLAEELRINRNTIAKAYAELESQGIIETLPGKAFFVKNNNNRPLNAKRPPGQSSNHPAPPLRQTGSGERPEPDGPRRALLRIFRPQWRGKNHND